MAQVVISDDQKQLLDKLYYDENNKASLRGIKPLYRAAKSVNKSITIKLVKEWLKSQPTYTLWKPARKNYKRNSFKIQFPKELMQFDLMDQRLNPENDETGKSMNFALIAVDSYSRFIFCVPLAHNTSQNIQAALRTILNTGYKPEKALGDKAGEHISASTRNFFKKNGIYFYTTSSKTKAPQAERFIRTARTYIRRYQNAKNTHNWLEPLKLCVGHYNKTKSRVTGQKPIDIMTKFDADRAAFQKLYGTKVEPETAVEPKRTDPKVGDKVRLSRLKGAFEKESTGGGNWTREYFTIKDLSKAQKLPMYGLEDQKGKRVEGRAYAKELQQIHVDTAKDFFEVRKVWTKKKVGGKMMALVSWAGYNRRHDSWIPASELKSLQQGTRNKRLQ